MSRSSFLLAELKSDRILQVCDYSKRGPARLLADWLVLQVWWDLTETLHELDYVD